MAENTKAPTQASLRVQWPVPFASGSAARIRMRVSASPLPYWERSSSSRRFITRSGQYDWSRLSLSSVRLPRSWFAASGSNTFCRSRTSATSAQGYCDYVSTRFPDSLGRRKATCSTSRHRILQALFASHQDLLFTPGFDHFITKCLLTMAMFFYGLAHATINQDLLCLWTASPGRSSRRRRARGSQHRAGCPDIANLCAHRHQGSGGTGREGGSSRISRP